MPTPAKKAATPKRAPAKRATAKATPKKAPTSSTDLILDVSQDMQAQAEAHYRTLGKAGAYFHGTDQDGRAIYKAID